jgi:hypothetical protein
MVRSLGGLALLVLAGALVACAPAGGVAPTSHANAVAASPTTTPGPSLSGDWIVQSTDEQAPCVGVDYRVVHIADDTATLSEAIAGSAADTPALSGPAAIAGDAVTIHMERSAPTKDAIDITGTLGDDGVVHGSAKAGGIHPGGTNGYTCTFALVLVPAVAGDDIPAFDTIAGTWCDARNPQSCMTIADGTVAFGDDPPEATLDDPGSGGFGPPCYPSGATPTEPGGGFALYYCPKGVAIQAGGGGVEGDIVAEHDDVAFDRVYVTQNPPYLGVYFRKDDLAAALQR